MIKKSDKKWCAIVKKKNIKIKYKLIEIKYNYKQIKIYINCHFFCNIYVRIFLDDTF